MTHVLLEKERVLNADDCCEICYSPERLDCRDSAVCNPMDCNLDSNVDSGSWNDDTFGLKCNF